MDAQQSLRAALLDQLRSRQFRPGQRLPTERALSAQYGLSRSGVRRVLMDLKKRRLITQTVGSGTYVSDDVGRALAEMVSAAPSMSTSPSELMHARMVLEPRSRKELRVGQLAISIASGRTPSSMMKTTGGMKDSFKEDHGG